MQENARKKAEHQLISELIDYREYLVSLASLTMRGKQKDFIKLVFNLYDEDGNGEVDREEYSVRATAAWRCACSLFQGGSLQVTLAPISELICTPCAGAGIGHDDDVIAVRGRAARGAERGFRQGRHGRRRLALAERVRESVLSFCARQTHSPRSPHRRVASTAPPWQQLLACSRRRVSARTQVAAASALPRLKAYFAELGSISSHAADDAEKHLKVKELHKAALNIQRMYRGKKARRDSDASPEPEGGGGAKIDGLSKNIVFSHPVRANRSSTQRHTQCHHSTPSVWCAYLAVVVQAALSTASSHDTAALATLMAAAAAILLRYHSAEGAFAKPEHSVIIIVEPWAFGAGAIVTDRVLVTVRI